MPQPIDFNQTHVMGILNVTPDSFSDGGSYCQLDAALRQAEQMIMDGATILDVGGESTRPGAEKVSQEQEIERVLPVIEAIRTNFDTPISIDTIKAAVMQEAVAAGASMINDVMALQGEGSLTMAAKLKVPVCLMHMLGTPRTMQQSPQYHEVVTEVMHFLQERAEACLNTGIKKSAIVLDPGFGFGKTLDHNLALLAHVHQMVESGYPILIGLSRKSMFGHLLGREVEERMAASLSGVLIAAQQGARIFRVHDVKETVDSLKVWQAVKELQE